jgi:hypothetical protein
MSVEALDQIAGLDDRGHRFQANNPPPPGLSQKVERSAIAGFL